MSCLGTFEYFASDNADSKGKPQDLGFRVSDLGFRVLGLGFRAYTKTDHHASCFIRSLKDCG